MKYLTIFFFFLFLSKATAQQANFSMSFGKGIDSMLTYLERDSLKRVLSCLKTPLSILKVLGFVF